MLSVIGLASCYSAMATTTLRLDATFTNFTSFYNLIPLAPHDPLHFALEFSPSDLDPSVTTIERIELTLGPKVFLPSEIGFIRNILDGKDAFGVAANGLDSVRMDAFDFLFIYDSANPSDFAFAYSAPLSPFVQDGWQTSTASAFSIATVTTVPEPSTLLLTSLGLVGVLVGRGHRLGRPCNQTKSTA